MVGGRLRDSICLFSHSALLLLGVFLYDVEASSCQNVIHKKVGDTVELSSCLPTEGVTAAQWRYGMLKIAEKYVLVDAKQFKGRLYFNPTNYSLTVRRLTLRDSGKFSFFSEVNDQQRKTVIITLHVHEPILTHNISWHTSNDSCTVSLECNATPDSPVTYEWTVRNQTSSGSRLEYVIRKQDENTTFTCTIRNDVSEMSASETVKCSKQEPVSISSSIIPLIIWPIVGILLFILLLSSLLWYTKSKDLCHNRLTQSQTVIQDETQQQVYSSLLHGDGSVYETIRGSEDAGTGDDCVYEPMGDSEEVGKEKRIISKTREAQMTT